MSSFLGLEGKRALVTGGTRGVGYAVVVALREAGATVLTTARSRPESLSNAEHFVEADVSTVEGCAAVANAVRDRLGGIDIVAHVVGGSVAPAGGFAVLDDNAWYKALDQNLSAAVRLDTSSYRDLAAAMRPCDWKIVAYRKGSRPFRVGLPSMAYGRTIPPSR